MSRRDAAAAPETEYGENEYMGREAGPSAIQRAFIYLGRFVLILMETVLLVAMLLYGVMYVLAKGPSPTARDMFVMSVRETSAIGFLANLYFTDEEIAQIEANKNAGEYVETDTSLININTEPAQTGDDGQGPKADAWGLVDEDGDGIIIDNVKGEGYSGYRQIGRAHV